ncbi:hypothetical protein [Undibacterium sp. Ren11W]|uniref:hypothetical protein n=1 Tax=Undibacterium sp. Ren11W TaxID=3413045 RepID=UPI003BF338C8
MIKFLHICTATLIILCAINNQAWAASEEIQVYMDEINAPKQFGLDIHTNFVMSGNRTPDYPGAQAPGRVFRITPEFSYGLTPNWELGAYILMSHAASENSTVDGEKIRLKFLATKASDQGFFWGANLEIGRVAYRIDENPWNAELKGMFGYRGDRWTVATNPNIGWKISGPVESPSSFHLDSKIAYKTDHDLEVGLESYNEFGPIHHMGHLDQQSQTVFAVVDFNVRGWDLNLGIGRGLTSASDRWVAKAIINVPF